MGNTDDEVPHRAMLTRDFYLGKTEVTLAQWKAVMETNPSEYKEDDLPVEYVSWNDAMEFCGKLNNMGKAPNGRKFTLPTETQWEYAACGGTGAKDISTAEATMSMMSPGMRTMRAGLCRET